jgi:hypothetical protein
MNINELLNIFLSIKENTYPKLRWWYGSDSSSFSSISNIKNFYCEICYKDEGIYTYFTIKDLELHGKTHVDEATRTLKLKEFL